jgi:hypothetical protein
MKHSIARRGARAGIVSATVAVLVCATVAASAALASGSNAQRRTGLGLRQRRRETVTVRVEGRRRTLLAATAVAIPKRGQVRKGGHSCPADSGAGAFNEAVHGRWAGTWSSSFADFLVTRILGETDSYTKTKTYWSLYVDNVVASAGICAIRLRPGEQILWAAVPDSATLYPLGFGHTTVRAAAGGRLIRVTVRVLAYNARGRTRPLAGASVSDGAQRLTSDRGGYATFTVRRPGRLRITAAKRGFIRDELAVTARR